jgi:aryl-alcohol dehydrogenase-like predicted oxidoreductase
MSIREKCGLLAYSPMAFGLLSGKYHRSPKPKTTRISLFENMNRYNSMNCFNATEKYLQIAEKHGFILAQMSLAFVNIQPFVTSNIIGATNMAQLKENIDSIHIKLGKEILKEINEVQENIPNPAP